MNPLTKTLLCLIATLPAAYAAPLILGDTTGNTRGIDAVDAQSVRADATQVAAGAASITIGQYNKATGDIGISIGYENTSAQESIAVGLVNSVVGLGYAFGYDNVIFGGTSPWPEYKPSGAFGLSNVVSVGADFSFVFGRNNTVSGSSATVFGAGISNSTPNSTMIGPSDAAKVTILSSGNVGIGTATPTSKLHVVGDVNVTGSVINPSLNGSGSGPTTRLRVGGTATPSTAWQGTAVVGADGQNKIITGYLASSTNGAIIGAHNSALTAWADLNVAGTNLIFRTNETERMRINSSGNVGIGTASPGAKLHVLGRTPFVGQAAFGTINDAGLITFMRGGDGTPQGSIGYAGASENNELRITANGGYGYIRFDTAGAGERMRIDATGNIGIGTTAPAAKLDVNGTVQIAGNVTIKNVGSTKSVIRISPAGDIDMGGFTAGTNPNP